MDSKQVAEATARLWARLDDEVSRWVKAGQPAFDALPPSIQKSVQAKLPEPVRKPLSPANAAFAAARERSRQAAHTHAIRENTAALQRLAQTPNNQPQNPTSEAKTSKNQQGKRGPGRPPADDALRQALVRWPELAGESFRNLAERIAAEFGWKYDPTTLKRAFPKIARDGGSDVRAKMHKAKKKRPAESWADVVDQFIDLGEVETYRGVVETEGRETSEKWATTRLSEFRHMTPDEQDHERSVADFLRTAAG
jgi:hypothetical protein